MNKLLIREISIDTPTKFYTFGTTKSRRKNRRGREAGPAFTSFPTVGRKATTLSHTRLEAGTARRGWEENKILIPLPQEVSMIATFPGPLPEQAQVLLCRQTLPQIQTPTTCSANHHRLLAEWQSKETNSMVSYKSKALFMEFNISEHFSSVKAVTWFKWKQHLGINSGTWVLGVTGMLHGFSSSHLKGPIFLFLSSHRYWWPAGLPGLMGNTKQRALLQLLGLP